jgi:UDP-N-acetylmuramate dehydrogenase
MALMNLLSDLLGEQVPLHDKNTYGIGGNARYYCVPEHEWQVRGLLEWADAGSHPLFVLGKGSNVLISDKGWPGLIMQLPSSAGTTMPVWHGSEAEVSGGASLNAFVKEVADRGFLGIEELAGIPGTIGGAVIMNAGAFSSCIADTLHTVTFLERKTGKTVVKPASDLFLGYRTSVLKFSGDIVLKAQFSFSRTEQPHSINNMRREILERRKGKQPLDYPNCGSVFKRPPGNYAGTLIERCGLKGLRCGGAEVSHKHANFIINTGNACADDVRHLIATVQQRVFETFGILLEPEVIFVGTFEEQLYVPPGEGQ